MLFSSRVRLGLGWGLDLVSGWLLIMHKYFYYFSVVIATLPISNSYILISAFEIPNSALGIVRRRPRSLVSGKLLSARAPAFEETFVDAN